MKVFLSHSSRDKDFVDAVANRLGRSRVLYDKYNFGPGRPFIEEIGDGIGAASHFVLFASRAALASDWVLAEIDEIRYRRVFNKTPVLVLLVGSGVDWSLLPDWITRGKVEHVERAEQAYFVIETFLASTAGTEGTQLFVGREELLAAFAIEISDRTDPRERRILAFAGLPGVGRRSVAQQAVRTQVGQRPAVVGIIGPHSSAPDLYLQFLSRQDGGPSNDPKGALTLFKAASKAEQAKELARFLGEYAALNIAPALVDDGGMLDESGNYLPWAEALLNECLVQDNLTVVLIHARRPRYDPTEPIPGFLLVTQIPPLPEISLKVLLRSLLDRRKIEYTPVQLDELAPYLDGYAPAAGWASDLAARYGVAGVVADKAVLVDIKVRTLSKVLQRCALSAPESAALRLLAAQPMLPVEALSDVLDVSVPDCMGIVRVLVDHNLVESESHGFRISKPVRDAVGRELGLLTAVEYARIARVMLQRYPPDFSKSIDFNVLMATTHALLRGRQELPAEFSEVLLPSAVHAAAESAYHAKEWADAKLLAIEALRLDRGHASSAKVLVKAQVRLEEYEEALISLEGYVGILSNRDYLYLLGFVYWKRAEYERAIEAFRRAIAAGYRAPAVYRDLAECLYRLAQYGAAVDAIEIALNVSRVPNKFAVDLAARIAIDLGDIEQAERYMEQLKVVESQSNYDHRLASLRAKQGRWTEVLALTNSLSGQVQRFESIALRSSALVELQRYTDAEGLLASLESRYPNSHNDVRQGLWCKLRLRQGRWREAKEHWSRLDRKDAPVHRALLENILRQLVADPGVSLVERKAAEHELGTTIGAAGVAVQVPSLTFDMAAITTSDDSYNADEDAS